MNNVWILNLLVFFILYFDRIFNIVTNLKFHRVTSEISFRFVQKTLSNSG